MKTLREYIDQLDEISRRDFLKGAGAAAVGAASGSAKGQVGAGENESLAAARQAIARWQRLARDNQSVTNSLYENLHRRIYQFYQMSRGVNFANATDAALRETLEVIVPEFERFEQILEKEKESGSLLKAYGLNVLGLGGLSRQEQLKKIGSMELVNLVPTANRFLQIYTDSLNRSLQQIQQAGLQSGSQQSGKPYVPKSQEESFIPARVIATFVLSSDKSNGIPDDISRSAREALQDFIQTYNAKEWVNTNIDYLRKLYVIDLKQNEPAKYKQLVDTYKFYAKQNIDALQKFNASNTNDLKFKESCDLEEASPDAIKRIEELVKYK